MDIATLGAALKGAKTQTEDYVESHFVAGANINIIDNPDGTQTIAASGEVSAEDSVARAALADHITDTSNPHSVNKEQVGLGNVDNTADMDKPISKAVKAELDNKVQKENGKGLSTNDFTDSLKEKLNSIIVNNSILTIQKNGTSVGTFSANQAENETINIVVPTSAEEVNALPSSTKYGSSIELSINSTTYVITAQLKDQNGNSLGAAKTIDLPLESVVVNGSYNSSSKKVILTLQNGSTIEFSVADLVAGLQSELSSSNKLNPAYIAYDSTHRAVTDTEKTTWNAKQAVLTSAQLSAVNSGIDSTKVGQIATNTTNITNLQTAWAAYNSYSKPVVYGYRINADNSIDYLADAVGKTPAAMGASTFDFGDWQNAFFMPKPCMLKSDTTVAYYLDPDDYSKKTDGAASNVADSSFDGNAMMEWGLIWYKYYTGEDGGSYFLCSNVNVDGTYTCWCNTDSRGRITPHFYTAIYNGTGTDKLRSLSGVALTSANGNGATTVTQEVERALANNTGSDVEWYTRVWCDRLLINSLLILIGKSLDTQATFGQGLSTGEQTAKEAYITGALNDKGLFWGDVSTSTSAVKVFGMENWWGCVWDRTAGCISIDNVLKIKLTYGANDGSTTIGYNQTGDGYITNGTIPTRNDYVAKMTYNKYGYMTSEVGSQANSPYNDYFYQNDGTRHLLVGGLSAGGVLAGAFSFALNLAPSNTRWYLAASLSCKPLA